MKKLLAVSIFCILAAGCAHSGTESEMPQSETAAADTEGNDMNSLTSKHFTFTAEDIAAGKYDVWELIDPLWFNVDTDGLDEYNKDLETFTDGQRKMLALTLYDAEVLNGGHDQFFYNSTGIVWKDALECMRMIGADECADNFQKTVDLFGGTVPFDRDERNAAMEKLEGEEYYNTLSEADDFYYDNSPYELMNAYIKAHPEEFALDRDLLYSN